MASKRQKSSTYDYENPLLRTKNYKDTYVALTTIFDEGNITSNLKKYPTEEFCNSLILLRELPEFCECKKRLFVMRRVITWNDIISWIF